MENLWLETEDFLTPVKWWLGQKPILLELVISIKQKEKESYIFWQTCFFL